jgi:alkylated DNA repair dioxygenase AlkB
VERYTLDDECHVQKWPAWLDLESAASVHQALLTELQWEQRSVQIFGRWVPQPRLIAWAGAVPYRYSGLTLEVSPPSPTVARLLGSVNEQVTADFNHVLLNRYRDGNDSMGWHADDEAELGPAPLIASVSLGAARPFLLKPKGGRAKGGLSLELGPGDLLLMAGNTQHRYVHSLPKRKAVSGERISLTFRRVLSAPR